MIRELTKSALSFSWALSLLGIKQTANMVRMGRDDGGDLFAPVTQMAVGQLDESMKGIYRSGDNMGSRMIDFAFSPMNWFKSGVGTDASGSMNPATWMNPSTWMRTAANMTRAATGCCGQSAASSQQASASTAPPSSAGATAGGSVPVSGQSATASWGPPQGSV